MRQVLALIGGLIALLAGFVALLVIVFGFIGAGIIGWVLRRSDVLRNMIGMRSEKLQPAPVRERNPNLRNLRRDPETGLYRPD